MATYTPNLNLKKPSTGERYDVIGDLNDAKDKIDLAVGNLKRSIVNVLDFGAKGDGVTDDTLAIKNAVIYAENQTKGMKIFFPMGTYKISQTIIIGKSGIYLVGASPSSSIISADSSNFDIIKFSTPSTALYNCGVQNLGITTAGNATAGYHLTLEGCIYTTIDNVIFNGSFNGMKITGCGKLFISKVVMSQESRTSGIIGKMVNMFGDRMLSGDIHFTDVQIMLNYANADPYTFYCDGVDGLYINNMHMHGGMRFNPSNVYFKNVIASVAINNLYIDSAKEEALLISGSAVADGFKDIRLTNVYLRDAVVGLRIINSTILRHIQVSNTRISQMSLSGLDIGVNTPLEGLQMNNIVFSELNTSNTPSHYPVIFRGKGCQFTNIIYSDATTTNDFPILVDVTAQYPVLDCITFINVASTARFVNNCTTATVGLVAGL